MNKINGKQLANSILEKARVHINDLALAPRLDIIFVGDDAGSEVYVQKKYEAGTIIGVKVVIHKFVAGSHAEVKALTEELANNAEVHGIILQLPAPGINVDEIFDLIPVSKDVDGLNPKTLGLLWQNRKCLQPATSQAVIKVLDYIATESQSNLEYFLQGKNVLIINRSLIIGKPLSAMLTNLNATVTIAHSKTENLADYLAKSDIVVSGAGVLNLIKAQALKPGSIFIDASFIKTEAGVSGDLDKNSGEMLTSYASMVPNGIGPVGVACLIANTVDACRDLQ